MDFIINNQAFAKNICAYITSQIREGKEYQLSFDEIKKTKTNQQRKYLFAIFEAISKYFISLGNVELTKEIVKDWIYDELGLNATVYLPNGKKIKSNKSLSTMTVGEMAEFISRLLIFIDSSDVLEDFILPPYLRYCWTKHVTEKQIVQAYKAKLPQKSEQFLRFQRSLSCIRCGRRGGEVHHIKSGSGLGRKNPDWFTIPICHDCHVPYLHSKVGENRFIEEIRFIINSIDIEVFCRLNFLRWQEYKI